MRSHVITLLTDFGSEDVYVGVMKGVILSIDPQARIVDLTHAVPPQQIVAGALLLRSAVAFFPPGTIHVAVVDPGVGSAHRPLVIEAGASLLLGPDNGVLSPAAAALGGGKARVLANDDLFRRPVSQTFHGRDVFAPVAAHLSRGLAVEAVGPLLDAVVELELSAPTCSGSTIAGEVVYVDHFGNLITNIDARALSGFPAQQLSVSIGSTRIAGLATAYAAAPEGVPLAIVGSWGTVEIAVRNGSAAESLAAGPGVPVTVVMESRDA